MPSSTKAVSKPVSRPKEHYFPTTDEVTRARETHTFIKVGFSEKRDGLVDKLGNLVISGARDKWISDFKSNVPERDRIVYSVERRLAGSPPALRACLESHVTKDELNEIFRNCITLSNHDTSMKEVYDREMRDYKEYKSSGGNSERTDARSLDLSLKEIRTFVDSNRKAIREEMKKSTRHRRTLKEQHKTLKEQKGGFIDVSNFSSKEPYKSRVHLKANPNDFVSKKKNYGDYHMIRVDDVNYICSDFNRFRHALEYLNVKQESLDKYLEEFRSPHTSLFKEKV
jgi:DNA-binding transcriptional MerR regulator